MSGVSEMPYRLDKTRFSSVFGKRRNSLLAHGYREQMDQ
jgi:hypothetical protein